VAAVKHAGPSSDLLGMCSHVFDVVLDVLQVEAAVKSAQDSAGPLDLLVTCAGLYRDTGTRVLVHV
jgi:NADP-dependent 3-hydroxy acid dehydrogenase YdfG